LDFDETPDFQKLISIMNNAIKRKGCDTTVALISNLLSLNELEKLGSIDKTRKQSLGSIYDICSFTGLSGERIAIAPGSPGCGMCNVA
jgi:hypothetical protein